MSTLNLGYKLRSLRLEKKLPLRKVAAMLDIDVAILSKMERGERKLTKEIVLKLAEIYAQNPDELIVDLLCEKILYVMDGEELALHAIQAAEGEVMYKNSLSAQGLSEEVRQRIIQKFKAYFSSQSLVSKAWVFGSFARRDDNAQSDIDIVIDVPTEKSFTFFDLLEVQENLQEIASRKVDVVMLNSLRPLIRARVEKDKIIIYEA